MALRFGFCLTLLLVACDRPETGSSSAKSPSVVREIPSLPARSATVKPEALQLVARIEELAGRLRLQTYDLPHNNWVLAHWLLVFGPREEMADPAPDEFRFLLRELCSPSQGEAAYVVRGESLFPRSSPEGGNGQSHRDQFLAYLSLTGAPLSTTFDVGGTKFPLKEILKNSLSDVTTTGELSWTLIAYAHYLPPSSRWTNKFGQQLCYADLVDHALKHPEDACRGAHYLTAIALAGHREDWQINDEYRELGGKCRNHLLALCASNARLREPSEGNATPSFAPFKADEMVRYVNLAGHRLEWMSLACTDDALQTEELLEDIVLLLESLEVESEHLRRIASQQESILLRYGAVAHACCGLNRWSGRLRKLQVGSPAITACSHHRERAIP